MKGQQLAEKAQIWGRGGGVQRLIKEFEALQEQKTFSFFFLFCKKQAGRGGVC